MDEATRQRHAANRADHDAARIAMLERHVQEQTELLGHQAIEIERHDQGARDFDAKMAALELEEAEERGRETSVLKARLAELEAAAVPREPSAPVSPVAPVEPAAPVEPVATAAVLETGQTG